MRFDRERDHVSSSQTRQWAPNITHRFFVACALCFFACFLCRVTPRFRNICLRFACLWNHLTSQYCSCSLTILYFLAVFCTEKYTLPANSLFSNFYIHWTSFASDYGPVVVSHVHMILWLIDAYVFHNCSQYGISPDEVIISGKYGRPEGHLALLRPSETRDVRHDSCAGAARVCDPTMWSRKRKRGNL